MEQLSEQDGDLTQRIDYDGQDEIGLMVSGFHMFIQKVQNIVQAAAEVSKELQAENIVFRNSVEKVVSSSERVAVTMEEHNSSTIVISDKNNEMSTYVDRLCQNINLFKYC